MRYWENPSTNEQGNFVFGGCDTVALAREYGTPLYVMDEQRIRSICRGFQKTLEDKGVEGMVLYASKAFSTKAIYKIVHEEGLGADVVSGGELYTALAAGFPPEKIYLHGNNKTPAEIEMAIDADIARIVIDSHEEIRLIAAIAKEKGKTVPVSLRVKPGIEAHTHEYIMTGTDDSKFGLGIYDGEALDAVEEILRCPELSLIGLHSHIGSQIFELEPFVIATERLTDFLVTVRNRFGATLSEINFGGGFGISYTDEDAAIQPYAYVSAMIDNLREQCAAKDLPMMRFVIEPGRSIVGDAGVTLYTVGTVKHIPDIRTYVSVDGGMTDNPRFALYQSKYTALLANKPLAPKSETVTVAGRCCESGDKLILDAKLPPCEAGDTLCVFSTGAYNYSMASNYNRLPIPAVVLANNGEAGLMVARQTWDQLLENDRIPSWLK